jgi:hypothetical protein
VVPSIRRHHPGIDIIRLRATFSDAAQQTWPLRPFPYATGGVHEHACIRCPFRRIDPNRLDRLESIEHSLGERIHEAEPRRGLADVAQLRRTLDHLQAKKQTLVRLPAQPADPLAAAGSAS